MYIVSYQYCRCSFALLKTLSLITCLELALNRRVLGPLQLKWCKHTISYTHYCGQVGQSNKINKYIRTMYGTKQNFALCSLNFEYISSWRFYTEDSLKKDITQSSLLYYPNKCPNPIYHCLPYSNMGLDQGLELLKQTLRWRWCDISNTLQQTKYDATCPITQVFKSSCSTVITWWAVLPHGIHATVSGHAEQIVMNYVAFLY